MNNHLFRKFIVLAFAPLILVSKVQAETEISINPYDGVRNLPGFSALIPEDLCNKEFPFHQRVSRNLHALKNHQKFSVFAFTTREFQATKESLMVIHGGPGGIWNAAGAKAIADRFANYNVVFFHYRGGGCSPYPSLDKTLDATISSIATVADMEGIRTAYGIKKWKSVIGFSYGTNIARMYAHFKPQRVGSVVLEGLDQPARREPVAANPATDSAATDQRIIGLIKERYQKSPQLQAYVSAANFKKFIDEIFPDYLRKVPVGANYLFLGFWDTYKPIYEKSSKESGQPMPSALNPETFAAITALAYANADEGSDAIVLALIGQFVEIAAMPADFARSLKEGLKSYAYMFYPFLNPDYLTYFKQGQLVSQRVTLAMPASDLKTSTSNLCTSVPVLVLNGTVDSATPVEHVKSYLENKSCASNARNAALIVQGGGHSNLSQMKCLSDSATRFIEENDTGVKPANCELPVDLKKF